MSVYVVFEGMEGSGKSTAMRHLAHRLTNEGIPYRATRHPGSTPLGAHLRKITKYPEEIDPNIELDSYSTQLLMVVDAINFYRTILEPSLSEGVSVLADRCNPISMIAYGLAEGLSPVEVNRLLGIMHPPKPDRVYVLQCPVDVAYGRMIAQGGGDKKGLDRFERHGVEFMNRLAAVYSSLTTGDPELIVLVNQCVFLENIKYIDSTLPPEEVARQIGDDFMRLLKS